MTKAKETERGKEPGHKFWTPERLDVWVRVGIPTLATLVIGFTTLFINHSISTRAEAEQSSRLYTELISRREQAASDLRKDMFGTILGGFVRSGESDDAIVGANRIDQDLMKLELLALNFGESLALGPLFAMMDRRVRSPDSYPDQLDRTRRPSFQARLESLARRVADAQRGSLTGEAKEFDFTVPSTVGETGSYNWPNTDDEFALACRTLGHVQRRFFLTLGSVRDEPRTVDVEMRIQSLALVGDVPPICIEELLNCGPELPPQCVSFQESDAVNLAFTLDPFNLPLIDNALLDHDQRFALIMRRFHDDSSIDIVGVLFPGAYAGRRDKLTLDQAIDDLRDRGYEAL